MVRKILRPILFIMIVCLIGFISLLLISDHQINSAAEGKLYDRVQDIPFTRVALIPGTSKFTIKGSSNLYYEYRIKAAVELYHAEKFEFIIASGDNRDRYYDEPTTIKKDLIEAGVPAEVIYRDSAGVRTLDSVIRARDIFGVSEFIFISQPFHNQRAIYLAQKNDMHVIGFNARDVSPRGGLRTQIRERFARIMALMDIYLFDSHTNHDDEPIPIGISPNN